MATGEALLHRAASAPAPIVEGLLITFFVNRRRLLALGVLVLGLAFLAAILVPVTYSVEAELLVAPGPEYIYRPPAGQPETVAHGLENTEAMHTEGAIISSPDILRATLRDVGLDRLYPKYLQPAGGIGAMLSKLKQAVTTLGGRLPSQPGSQRAAPDPLELALKEFESKLTFDVPKSGSVITVMFKHPDPVLAAEAVNRMMALYVDRRADLFRDDQSALVAQQVAATQRALTEAQTRLADFERTHQAGGFEAQRDILLRRRGELETDRSDAQSQIAQLTARHEAVMRQFATTPADLAAGRDTDYELRLAPARSTLEQLRAQYATALAQYQPDAPLVQSLRAQLATHEADVAEARRDRAPSVVRTAQNPAWLGLQDDRLKSESGLAVQQARLAADEVHLAELRDAIARFEAGAQELDTLRLQRTVAEETYRSATKTLEDQRVAEQVAAHRRATVRVLQPAVAPVSAPPTRRLLLMAGIVLSVFSVVIGTLIAHAFADTYWQPEALEHDMGIALLATVNEVLPSGSSRRRGAAARRVAPPAGKSGGRDAIAS